MVQAIMECRVKLCSVSRGHVCKRKLFFTLSSKNIILKCKSEEKEKANLGHESFSEGCKTTKKNEEGRNVQTL